jgi:hypothetical protein
MSPPSMVTSPAFGNGATDNVPKHGLMVHALLPLVVGHVEAGEAKEAERLYEAPRTPPGTGQSLVTVNDPEPVVAVVTLEAPHEAARTPRTTKANPLPVELIR